MNLNSKRTTGKFQSLDLFFLNCLFLTVEAQQGHISPPQNVSLQWIMDFKPQLSWAPPQHPVKNCRYVVTSEDHSKTTILDATSPSLLNIQMEGGLLELSVIIQCNDTSSEKVVIKRNYTDLVSNLECYTYSNKGSRCSWCPTSNVSDLRFFYSAQKLFTTSTGLQECSSYNFTDGMRSSCDLEVDVFTTIVIMFNGTVNNAFSRNTFRRYFFDDVRPPVLKWNAIKEGDKFLISWTPPDIKLKWKFTIKYIECEETKYKYAEDEETSTVLPLVPHCPYRMAIAANVTNGWTQWCDELYFAAETNPVAWVYAAIVIPLMFAGLALLIFVYCKKNMKYIFPDVPEPRNLLCDISENNNTSIFDILYVPVEDEDNFKITLVTEPQIKKLDY